MKKIFTKSTIKYLLRGWVGIEQHYRDLFQNYRDLCGDDINLIHQSITGYAIVHTFGRNVNVSEFRSREEASNHLRAIGENQNIQVNRRDTSISNSRGSWEIVKL